VLAMRQGIWVIAFLILLTGSAPADEIDEVSDSSGGPILLTMNHTAILHLREDADNVILNNHDHAGVTIDNPRLLIITPHSAGATSMIVMGRNEKIILQKDIIVSNVQQDYVRVRRVCNSSDASCQSASYSYCPNGCYDVTEIHAGASGGAVAPPPPSGQPGLIGGEPAETLIGPADECPEGYQKVYVQGVTTGDQHYTCTR